MILTRTIRCIALTIAVGIAATPWAFSQKTVSLEDVWKDYTFTAKSVRGVRWMKDGQHYTKADPGKISKIDMLTGQEVEVLFTGEFDSYDLSAQEDKLLLATQEESIYRRSSKAFYKVYDKNTGSLQPLSQGAAKQMYASFSPDGNFVAFVRDNNLFVTNLATGEEKAITTTGEQNKIIHGGADWVYEEEFGFAQAFFWSPDSKRIAFYTFDESQVKEFNMQMWGGKDLSYPNDYRFKYPKAGEDNAMVAISVYDVPSGKTIAFDLGADKDIYIPRVSWTQNSDVLAIRKLNRLQNELTLYHAQVSTGVLQSVLTEQANTYIDLEFCDDLIYLKDGKYFLSTSEKSGFKHIFLHTMDGKVVRPITEGNWEVTLLIGIDEEKEVIYFVSHEVSPLEKQLYSIGLNGKNKTRLTQAEGVHNPNFSPSFRYYLDYHSAAQAVPTVSLYEAPSGKLLKVLEDNSALKSKLAEYQIQYKEFFQVPAADNTPLNGWMIKPLNFDPNQKYPVLMFVYGGPGSQQVVNGWDPSNFFWYQHLASKGYLIVCVDNRGTGGRGADFKKVTYAEMGKYEVADQVAVAQYLQKQPFVDAARIGIWGWSYGGYMSSLCITIGADVFKTAIAVAPVTNWRFYDTIYTERFLKRPQDNPSGYDDFSPLTHADKLKGNYLLVHGTGDDNVHFQNAVAMQDALIKAGKQFQSFYYPNRNHGIYGGNTRLHLYQMMTNFLINNL